MKSVLQYIFHRDHLIITLSAFLQLWLLSVVALNLDFLNPVARALDNFSITDFFFDIQHAGSEPETSDLITLVDMTELTSRGDIAEMLEEIHQCDPLAVGVDLIFEGEKDDLIGNDLLEGVIQGMRESSVFSMKLTDYDSSQGMFTGSVRTFFADRIALTEAYTNLNDDLEKSCIRDFSVAQVLNGVEVLSFPARIASRFDPSIAEWEGEDLLINFRNVSFPVVSYKEISEKVDLIEGHVILVGTMTEEQDMHNTPLGKMPGMELQAYSLLTLLEHNGLRTTPKWLSWLLAFVVCYLLELTLGLLDKALDKVRGNGMRVFLKMVNLSQIVLLFVWMVFFCWLMYMMFVKSGFVLPGGIILGLMALTCEGRELYEAFIKALRARNPESRFAQTSLIDDD